MHRRKPHPRHGPVQHTPVGVNPPVERGARILGATPGQDYSRSMPSTTPGLSRPADDRIVAGVCSGLARRFGLSPGLVRFLFVLSILLPGPQVIAYLVLWLVLPAER